MSSIPIVQQLHTVTALVLKFSTRGVELVNTSLLTQPGYEWRVFVEARVCARAHWLLGAVAHRRRSAACKVTRAGQMAG